METLAYYHLFSGRSHEPAVELAERIKALAPGRMARVFYQSSGSEANDTQVKLAWYYNNALGRPKKKKIISRQNAYHGVTIVAASLTGLPNNHRDFDLPVAGIRHVSTPHYWRNAEPGESEAAYTARLAAELEALILAEGPDTVAAFIAEPVMGVGGVIVPPEGYFPAMAAVCRRHDVLMISDEVICGFGRTGAMVRGAGARLRAQLDLHGQAADRGLPAALRRGDRRRDGRGDRGQLGADRHARARLHLRRAPGGLRGRGEGAGDLRAGGHAGAGARAGAALRRAPRAAGRASAGGRGARDRADGGAGAGAGRGPRPSPSRARSARAWPPSSRRAA